MAVLSNTITFNGLIKSSASSFNSIRDEVLTFSVPVKATGTKKVPFDNYATVINGQDQYESNSPPVLVTGGYTPRFPLLMNTVQISGTFPRPGKYVSQIDSISVNVQDSNNYVIVTGSGIAVGMIPFWS